MPGTDRHLGRVLAMQAACQLDVHGEPFLADLAAFLTDASEEAGSRRYAEKMIRDFHDWKSRVDDQISAAAEHWRLDRLGMVDRAVLRMATTELLQNETPPRVVIDEAIEIAREFGGKDSPTFINGVLDRIWKRMQEEVKTP